MNTRTLLPAALALLSACGGVAGRSSAAAPSAAPTAPTVAPPRDAASPAATCSTVSAGNAIQLLDVWSKQNDATCFLAAVDRYTAPASLKRQVTFQAAQSALTAGFKDKAALLLQTNVDADPTAVASARLLGASAPEDKADAVCSALAGKDRAAQALACVDGAGASVRPETVRNALSAQVALTPADLRDVLAKHATAWGSDVLAAMDRCEKRVPLNIDWLPVHIEDLTVPQSSARIFELLSDNADAAARTCLLAVGAASCVQDIQKERECPSVSAIASYAQAVFSGGQPSAEDLANADRFVGTLFGVKKAEYATPETPVAKSALLQLHVALAYIYKKLGKVDRYRHDWTWHQNQAMTFWSQLHPDAPFPASLALK